MLAKGYVPEGKMRVEFILKIPKKGRQVGTPHTSKPDIDNLLKALIEALCPNGDQHIYQVAASKKWGLSNEIIIYGD